MRTIRCGLLCIFVIFPLVLGPGCSGTVSGVSDRDGDVEADGSDAAADGQVQQDGTVSGDNAEFVSQSVAASVAPGANFQAEFTMRNTGTTTWSEADQYRLGSWNPQDNDTWGTGRIQIQGATSVAPNDTYVFTADLTAPATPGSYTMQWRMVHEFVNWFGDPTDVLTIQVEDTCFDHCNNQQMDCGETYIDCGGDCAACQSVELATLDASGSYPRVAVASYDKVMVVWHRGASSADSQIRWSCFGGTGWSGPARVTQASGHAGYPWMVADSQQRFHLVYSHGLGDGRFTHYNRYDAADCAGQWHDPAEVLPRALSFSVPYPSVGVDQNDRPMVTFSQSLAAKPSPVYPPCNNTSDCAADYHCYPYPGPGQCHPDYAQYYTRRTSGTFGSGNWTSPGIIAVGLAGHVSHHGTIFVQGSSLAHTVWLQAYPGLEIYYSQYNGSGWSTPDFTGIGGCHAADVQADAQDVFVFSDTARFVSRPVSSPGNWSSVENVGSGGAEINLVKMRIDQSGHLHAVWNGSGFRIMYAMTDSNGNWLAQKPVSPAAEESHQASLDVDSDGNAHIVWAQCTPSGCVGEFGSIWYLKTRYDELP